MKEVKLDPVKQQDRRIVNIHTAEFKPWDSTSSESSGQSVLQLNDKKPLGIGFHVFKMSPGTTTESHEHTGDEEFLILSGDLTDNDGTEYQEGDLVWMKEGTQHNSTTKNGCVLAVYIPTTETLL